MRFKENFSLEDEDEDEEDIDPSDRPAFIRHQIHTHTSHKKIINNIEFRRIVLSAQHVYRGEFNSRSGRIRLEGYFPIQEEGYNSIKDYPAMNVFWIAHESLIKTLFPTARLGLGASIKGYIWLNELAMRHEVRINLKAPQCQYFINIT